jgi:hypothetical protein
MAPAAAEVELPLPVLAGVLTARPYDVRSAEVVFIGNLLSH